MSVTSVLGRCCRCRTVSVNAVAQPLQGPKGLVKSTRGSSRATVRAAGDHVAAPAVQQKDKPLVLNTNDTHMHNSFYLPESSWNDVLVIEGSSSWAYTDFGPTCTTKYGM